MAGRSALDPGSAVPLKHPRTHVTAAQKQHLTGGHITTVINKQDITDSKCRNELLRERVPSKVVNWEQRVQ